MKLTLAETKFIKDSISIISDIVAEGRFSINKDGIELVAMDPANVAMVIFKLLSSTFVEYEVNKPETISVNLNELKQVLKRAKANDTLTLETSEGKLKIVLKSNTTKTFYLSLIDFDEKEQKVPELKFGATITTSSSLLNEAIEDVDMIGESVSLIAQPRKLSVLALSELSKANVDIPADEDTKIVAEETVKSKFSIEYLKKMIHGSKLSEKVVVQISNDYPLRLEYKVLNKVNLVFILAPRVDTD